MSPRSLAATLAALAGLLRRSAAIKRELAEIDDAIAEELSPSKGAPAKKAEKPRKRPRRHRP